ncbi:hypothetical protein [Ensifer sp.]|jgi:hypothetical protein|uniref:hypothetical protein n=1 Tax=Ensifer sp. TaxID=1872086 RepID=UPI002E111A8C|nr:hypothetical protein [Ensifer sp.]
MKIIIAAVAALAIATPALAVAPSAFIEQKAVHKPSELIELANGPGRIGAASPRQNNAKSRERNKGSTTDGRELNFGK